jgi:uncharacterized protein
VIVWIGTTIGADAIEPWATRAFAAWGIGRKGKDDGVAVFVLAQDHKVRIEVGYGLEGQLTDLTSSRIIRDQITPRLREGDRDGAIVAAVDGVLSVLGGEAGRPARGVEEAPAPRPLGLGEMIVLGVVGLLLLIFVITHPALAAALLFTLSSGGRRGGGGGFSGGGFSGGGGRSGGGGASGSW